MTALGLTFIWNTELPRLEGYGYSARIERLPYGHKYRFMWTASCSFALHSGYADSVEGAQRDAEIWIRVEQTKSEQGREKQ